MPIPIRSLLLASFSYLLPAVGLLQAQAENPGLTVSSVQPGSLVVALTSAGQVRAVQFDIVYDPALVALSPVVGGAAQSAAKGLYTSDVDTSTKRFVITGMNDDPMPDGAVVNVSAQTRPAGCDATPTVRLVNIMAAGADGGQVDIAADTGNVPVQAATAAVPVVQNAASLAVGPVAPGEIISIFGCGIGGTDVTVAFDGQPASVLFAGPNQVNAIAPASLDPSKRTARVEIRSQRNSQAVTVALTGAMPGIFTRAANGSGPAAVLNENGTPNSPSNPAAVGSIITIYATGVWADDLSVEIDGRSTQGNDATEISPGVVQLRVRIPQESAANSVASLVVTSDGVPSQSGVSLSIQ